MSPLSFKFKILLLTTIPLMVVSVLIISITVYQARQLGDRNIESFKKKIYDLRKIELKNYTNIAKTAITHFDIQRNRGVENVEEQAKQIVRNMSYGEDGYFFVYDRYTTLVHPRVPSLEGKNQREMTDPRGVKIIEELYDRAQQGGGFTNYIWLKPSRGREVDKISYSDKLAGLDWWIGTGLYVDDLEEAVANIQHAVDDNISTTLRLIVGLAIGTVVFLGLIGARLTLTEGRLADEKLQQLSRKAVSIQEDERRKVALDLRKNISQSLSTIRHQLCTLYKSDPPQKQNSINSFTTAAKKLNRTIEEIHRISGELNPVELEQLGLYVAVETLAKKAAADGKTQFVVKKGGIEKRLSTEVENTLYRITQEAINNILKHSKANKAIIHLQQKHNNITLNIHDNGIGFSAKDIVDGKDNVGIVDMRVRAESLRGTFSVYSSPGAGTAVKASIPLG